MPRSYPHRNLWPLAAALVLALSGAGFRWASSSNLDPMLPWPLFAACLAMWVPIGLALLASGGLTEQRAALTALMGIVALGVASIGYFLTGFAFQFGGIGLITQSSGLNLLIWEWSPLDKDWGLGWGLLGLRGFVLSAEAAHPQAYALFLSQLAPLSVAVLLPLLALRGRVKPLGLMLSTLVLAMGIYPIIGNWALGGGWLANLGVNVGLGHGFLDFAGSGTVHLVGASVALAGLVVFAPSRRWNTGDLPARMPPIHLPILALLGGFLVVPGWIGLALSNPLHATADIAWPVVAVNLIMAAVGGSLLALLYSWFTTGAANVFMVARGLVSGLVAISAACPFVPAWSALLVGGFAGLLLPLAAYLLTEVVKLDDQSLIVPIHGLSAVWGILAAALFADGRYGKGWNGVGVGEYLGVTGQGVTGYLTPSDIQPDFPQQMYAQLVGLLAIVVVSFFVSWLVFKLMSSFVRTREGAGLEPSTFSGSSEALSSATTPTSPASGVLAEGKSPGKVG